MKDGVTIMAEDHVNLGRPVVVGTITFADGTISEGSVLDGVEIQNQTPSMYMKTRNNCAGISNPSVSPRP